MILYSLALVASAHYAIADIQTDKEWAQKLQRVPRIELITPKAVAPGGAITIEIGGLEGRSEGPPPFLSAESVNVSIGGVSAYVLQTSASRHGQALITVGLPTLDDGVRNPTIYVSILGNLLRYDGDFRVLSMTERISIAVVQYAPLVLLAFVIALSPLALRNYLRKYRLRLDEKSASSESSPPPTNVMPQVVEKTPPPELIQAIANGECVAIVGPGMSAMSGLSPWSASLESLIAGMTNRDEADLLRRLLRERKLDLVIDSLRATHPRELISRHVQAFIAGERPRNVDAYSSLLELPLSGIVSMNLDDLVERVAARNKSGPDKYVPRDADACLTAMSRQEPFYFRLRGNLGSTENLVLSQQDLLDAVSRNDALRELLKRLYYSRSLLFLGVYLRDVQSLFQSFDRTAPPTRRHFALAEVDEVTWTAFARSLEKQFEVDVLPYSPDNRKAAISGFLEQVQSELKTSASAYTPTNTRPARIEKVVLRNIGPFAECALEIDPTWTVLLGDNGVGKSTVLRAIAVALCGKASAISAGRLLKSGTSSGSIALYIGSRQYLTTLARKSDGSVAIETPSGIPLEREGVLAMGFSALRTIGWTRTRSSEAIRQRPTANDLLPLTSEEPDSRLDGVKQWLVRLDHLRITDGVSAADRARYGALYERVFEVLGKLATGVEIEPGHVNPNTGEITIRTKDGPIPIESLSQGTLSLVGWAGTLMQRLYETAPRDVEPLKSGAIVLVDEIDAHMHPAWQQTLVRSLSEIFEHAQFLATSHSPLVVGGLETRQVYRFERDRSGVVQVGQPEYSLKGLGVAGLLTSGLFGLASHLDPETSEALERKRQLTAKKLQGRINKGEIDELVKLDAQVSQVDFTQSTRDPMYKEFVAALSRAESTVANKIDRKAVLNSDEREQRARLADQIVRELKAEKDDEASNSAGRPA